MFKLSYNISLIRGMLFNNYGEALSFIFSSTFRIGADDISNKISLEIIDSNYYLFIIIYYVHIG